jgi:transcriptional regulator with XRE-family HTH domain
MGRKVRPPLAGLEALGARLKQIRQQSGLSQMKLAYLIGFDPAHGYKYILRLEKGQVPNPTLRTIAACLEACGVAWRAIVDVLPSTGMVKGPVRRPLFSGPFSYPGPMTAGPRPAVSVPVPALPPPRRKDARPMREQLRSRRIEQRDLHTRRFWSAARQVDEATTALLHSLRVPSGLHRAYLSFARACCSTIDAFNAARPEVAERELARLVQPAVAQGLDRTVLAQIQSSCIRVFGPQTPADKK